MLVEFTIASGPPIVEKPQKLSLDGLPVSRAGTKYTFKVLASIADLLDHDDFFVMRTADTINNAGKTLIWELSGAFFRRPLLILDGGVSLASLSAAQIRNRMGL